MISFTLSDVENTYICSDSKNCSTEKLGVGSNCNVAPVNDPKMESMPWDFLNFFFFFRLILENDLYRIR